MRLSIETADRSLLSELFNRTTTREAEPVVLAEGVTIIGDRLLVRKAVDFPSVADVIVGVGGAVATGVAANLVTDWLKRNRRRIERLTIERMEIDLDDEGQVRRIITEKLDAERRE